MAIGAIHTSPVAAGSTTAYAEACFYEARFPSSV